MLNRADKEALVKSLNEDINKAGALFLTNLIGVTSNDAVSIRKGIREAAGKVIVTRNTLFSKAAEGTYAEELFKNLKGPHAVALAFEDAPGVAKCLKEAGKEHELVDFKGGYLNGEALSIAQIKELADLPSRDEMLGTLLATFNAPISAFARVLEQIREQKDDGSTVEAAVEEAPVTETTETKE